MKSDVLDSFYQIKDLHIGARLSLQDSQVRE